MQACSYSLVSKTQNVLFLSTGLVLMLSGDIYYILYEDDEVPYPEPVEIIQKGLTKGTVIVL